jgi:ankyrin repeat protein
VTRLARAATLLALIMAVGAPAAQGPVPGTSVLSRAVQRGDREAVRALLLDGVDVDDRDADGTTPLHWAVRLDDVELVRTLIRAGADVAVENRYGLRPITLAATNGSERALRALLDAGADPAASAAGEPVVMTAARTGAVDALELLVARGADVNAREAWLGETALMWAAAENHADAVRLLVEAGADVDARSAALEAPVLEFPRSGGPNSPFPRGGWTALMFAAREGAIDAAAALADLGADLDAVAPPQTDVPSSTLASLDEGVGTTALVYAIINVHYELAAVLLEKGADPNVADLAGMAALYAAVDMNSLQRVQGRPAPIQGDRLDGVDLVGLLLEKGADPNARLTGRPLKRHHDAGSTMGFSEGATPLMRAARTGDVPVMRRLLEGGADPFLTLPDRTNALMIAAGQGYGGLRGEAIRIVVPTEEDAAAAVALLLDHGMDADAFNATGNTALHAAVRRGDPVVRVLAARGATLDLPNRAGQTPLDIAEGRGGRGRGGGGRESTAALLRELVERGEAAAPSARPGD